MAPRSSLVALAALLAAAHAIGPSYTPNTPTASYKHMRHLQRLRGGQRDTLVPPSSSTANQAANTPPKPPLLLAAAPSINIPRELELFIGSAGIFLSFSVFAVLQEDVYKKAYGGEFFAYTFFALVIERGVNALTALAGNKLLGGSGTVIPHEAIFASGVSQVLAMAGSNEALRYVSYPTQVLGKSCKMVPVMAGGIVLGGKRYSAFEYAQVLLITAGVTVFNFGGKKKKSGKADSPLGLGLIGLSLMLDAVTGGLQDRVKMRTKELNPAIKGARPSMHESMLWTNASGCAVALLLALVTGHLFGGISFCRKHPEVFSAILVYSIASAVGQNFVYYTLTQFNPLVLTTVTTTRKIFSTLFSVFRNPANSLAPMQWAGCSLVFGGLIGDILKKLLVSKPAPMAASVQVADIQAEQAEQASPEAPVAAAVDAPSLAESADAPDAASAPTSDSASA